MKNKKDRVLFIGATDPDSNYVKKLERLREQQGSLFETGTVSLADILHDDWCALLNGADRCNCDPEIRVREIKKEQ